MGAPKGNEFWKLRSKHGRDKIFSSPEMLWDAACEYFEWCNENPLIEFEHKGKDVGMVEVPKIRAFTLIGLCHMLGVNTDYFTDFKESLKEKEDELSKDFSRVITRVYEVIYRQKFEGAAADLLNPNIIARDLGLKDKADLTTDGEKINQNINISMSLKKKGNDKV